MAACRRNSPSRPPEWQKGLERERGGRKKKQERGRGKKRKREVAKETALSSKSSCDCRRNAVTAEGEGVKTNWIFASVTSFFTDNSDVFSPCGRSLKPERRRSWRRLYNRLGSIAVLSWHIPATGAL